MLTSDYIVERIPIEWQDFDEEKKRYCSKDILIASNDFKYLVHGNMNGVKGVSLEQVRSDGRSSSVPFTELNIGDAFKLLPNYILLRFICLNDPSNANLELIKLSENYTSGRSKLSELFLVSHFNN